MNVTLKVIKTHMKLIWNILIVCTILSCRSDVQKRPKSIPAKAVKKEVDSSITIDSKAPQHEVMEFVEYNDDGDYFLLMAKKKNSIVSFINDNDDRTLLRGDLIDISWKTTTIEIAGDGGTQEQAEKIVSVVKVKDGKVSKFRRDYAKPLKYTFSEDENYSKYYLDKLYILVEYYIANSKNELLKLHINNRDELTFSIEKQIRESREYTMIGISTTSEKQVNTVQWLYFDHEKNILYEYDLANDKLVEFN